MANKLIPSDIVSMEPTNCDIVETSQNLVLACILTPRDPYQHEKKLLVNRYTIKAWPPRLMSQNVLDLDPYDDIFLSGIRLSSQGAYVAYWGRSKSGMGEDYRSTYTSTFHVLDIFENKILFSKSPNAIDFYDARFNSEDREVLLVQKAQLEKEPKHPDSITVLRFDLQGNELGFFQTEKILWLEEIFWTPENKMWLVGSSQAQLYPLPKQLDKQTP